MAGSKDKESAASQFFSGLFWKTFGMLFILVLTSVGAWLYGLSVLDEEPPGAERVSAHYFYYDANPLCADQRPDTSYRFDLIMALAQREGLNILPKEPSDRVEPLEDDRLNDLILENVRSSLGKDTMLARRINGMPGLWVSFKIDEDEYWLRCERSSNPPRLGTNWIFWFGGMLFVCTLFTVLLTNRLIDPLSRLSSYARQLGRGILPEPLPLDGPREIQEVNESFNVMVSDMKRLQSDRELLLAGVSHDLRTPITRLRLEVELAPISEETRNAMCSDLDQMESIVKQFMAYVRQGETELSVVDISSTLREVIAANRLSTQPDVTLKVSIDDNLEVRAIRRFSQSDSKHDCERRQVRQKYGRTAEFNDCSASSEEEESCRTDRIRRWKGASCQ